MTLSYSQASPAAHTPETDVSSCDEHLIPPRGPISNPDDLASMTSGTAPTPISTPSQSIERPDEQTTRSTVSPPSKAETCSPDTTSMSCETNRSRTQAPTCVPNCNDSGSFSGNTSVDATPCVAK